ncbi:lycopene cyclase domain-containing protein [Candidatus Saccharibacteria bacterium]|nr:lycopene cyclase domain-containing protein [Candidatus Saccharibacteria bacterium]
MMQWLYLLALILAITGVAALDRRYHLAFWYDRNRTIKTLAISTIVFILWDMLAIRQGIFIHGNSQYSLPFTLFPEFPVEEIFFLLLLCYSALSLYRGGQNLWPRT